MKKLLVTAIALTFSAASFGMNVGCEYHTFRSHSSHLYMTMVHTSICKGKLIGYHPGQKIKVCFIYHEPIPGGLTVLKGSPFSIGRESSMTKGGVTINRDILCKATQLMASPDRHYFVLDCNAKIVVNGHILDRQEFGVPMSAVN